MKITVYIISPNDLVDEIFIRAGLWCCWDFEGRGRQEQIRGWYFKLFIVHSVTKRAREPPLWLQTSWIAIFLLILLSLLYLWLPKVQLYSIVASFHWVSSFSGLKKSIGDLMCKWLNRDVRIFWEVIGHSFSVWLRGVRVWIVWNIVKCEED